MTRRRRRGGFTLIEVMVSLGVMTIAAMSIVALQAHAIRANTRAREMTIATMIAERWIERLKQDAHTWNRPIDPNIPNDGVAVLGNTQWLRTILNAANTTDFIPLGADGPGITSAGFTWNGADASDNAVADPGAVVLPDGPVTYCAAYRLAWALLGRAMRVDVRVWWAKTRPFPGDPVPVMASNFGACNTNLNALEPPATDNAPGRNYHIIQVPGLIRMVTVER
jgi:type II secretion system protein I